MKKNLFLSVITLVLFSILLLGCSKEKAYRSIKIFSYKGTCNIIRGKKELDLAKEMKIKNNDELQVKEDSQAVLKLDNDKFVCVKENTDVKFVATGKENNTKTRLHVNNGGVIVEVKEKLQDKESFEIASSNSVMAIRGTQISFDVSKTTDSITTTFSILTGNTETYLYKDETMNSTTLIHDKMMSYTTSLSKTTDEIFKLYDSFKPVEITDVDLKEKYNTGKLDITNEMIDEIVNATNEFERIDNKINKTIDFTISANVAYGTNPIDSITISDDINEFVNVKYLFSQSLDGEFKEESNLSVGKWYIKIVADNAYESLVRDFKVVKEKVEFDIPNKIDYSDNILEKVSGVDKTFNLYISKNYSDGYQLFNINKNYDLGMWYVKVESSYITSEPQEIEIVKKVIDLSIPESIEYSSDLNLYNYITSNVSDYEIYMINSKTDIDELYNPTYALELGDYKSYLKKDNDYYINSFIKTFKIVKININFDYDETFEYGDSVADHIRNVSMDDYEIHYSTEETGAYNIIPTANNLDAGKYYIKVVSGTYYESKPVVITITPVNNGNFSIEDAVYGADITSGISGVTFANYDVYVSSTIDGEYTLYDYATMMQEQNILDAGTYYAKVVSNDGNYYYNPQQFTISPYPFDYTLSDQIDYGFDIRNYINRPTVDTFDILISTSTDGEYTLYDPSEPLALGTYYIKLDAGSNFIVTDPKEIEVVNVNANFFYTYTQVNGNGTAGVKVKIDSEKFFKSSFAQEKDIDGNYLYNVVVSYNDGSDKTYTFDYEHRELLVENFGDGIDATQDSIDFTYTYNMPTLVNPGNVTEHTYEAANALDFESASIQYDSSTGYYKISAKLSYYTYGNATLVARYIPDNSGSFNWTDAVLNTQNAFEVSANAVSDNAIRVYFAIKTGDNQYDPSTDVITFDTTTFSGFNNLTSYSMKYNNEPLYTFNSDGTINIYKDFEFVNKVDYDLLYEVAYTPVSNNFGYDYDTTNTRYARSSYRLLVLEDLPYDSYGVTAIRIIRVIEDTEYILYEYTSMVDNYDTAIILYEEGKPISYNEAEGKLICSDDRILPSEYLSLTAVEHDNPSVTYEFTGFSDSVHVVTSDTPLSNVPTFIDYEFTEAMIISTALQSEIGSDTQKVTNFDLFGEIMVYMNQTYGLDIKGTYYINRTVTNQLVGGV